MYQAVGLYQGWRVTACKRDQGTWPFHLLILSASCSLFAGIIGGLLGIGGGFVMGPLFIELGIAPQVSSENPFTRVLSYMFGYTMKNRDENGITGDIHKKLRDVASVHSDFLFIT